MDRAATSADATAGCRIVGIRALVKLPVKGRWRSSCYELDILGTSPFWNHDCIGLPDRESWGGFPATQRTSSFPQAEAIRIRIGVHRVSGQELPAE